MDREDKFCPAKSEDIPMTDAVYFNGFSAQRTGLKNLTNTGMPNVIILGLLVLTKGHLRVRLLFNSSQSGNNQDNGLIEFVTELI